MTKLLLASAAAIALMTGVASAQTTIESSRTTTVTPVAPPVESYTSKTEKSTFGGASVESKKTYQNGPDGSVATQESKVVRPDGSSEMSSHKEWSTAPAPLPPASSTTTTTTTVR